VTAKEMIEEYRKRYRGHNTFKVLAIKTGFIAKIKKFCYNFFRR